MESFLLDMPGAGLVYCLGRVAVLGILASSEALLARHKREGFERHLILFSACSLLMGAELFAILLALVGPHLGLGRVSGIWAWYPALSTVGLLGVAFCFDYVGTVVGVEVRRRGRHYLMLAAFLLAFASLLTGTPFNMAGFATSVFHMGAVSFVLHGAQAAATLLLAWKVRRMAGRWLSRRESRVFLLGCAIGLIGALLQIGVGPHEHFTTVAFTLYVAVLLRDNYRRSSIEAVRASEDRNAKMLLFHRVTTQLKSFELSALYEILMDSLVGNLGAESGAIYLLDGRERTLKPALIHGPYPSPLPLPNGAPDDGAELRKAIEALPVPEGEGVIGRVALSGVPLYTRDAADAARHYTWPTGGVKVQTAIALPLRSPDGVYGVVQIVNRMDGGTFGEEELRFMSLFVEQAGLAIYNAGLHAKIVERQRTQEQLKIARQIQLRLIPSELPEIPALAIGAEYRAAQEVGGDYFDFYRIDHDHLGIVVFDVAGKGVPGALLMAITSTFLKMAAPRSRSPAWVLNEVNAALSAEMRRGLYVTATYAVLKLSTLELTLCCAGHTDAIIFRDADATSEKHKPRGAALGLLRPNRFRSLLEQKTIHLKAGDTLVLYTDGVIEAMDENGNEFGEERLCELVANSARKGPKRLTAAIVEAVQEHAGQQPQYDDITVVALRVGDAPAPSRPPAETT